MLSNEVRRNVCFPLLEHLNVLRGQRMLRRHVDEKAAEIALELRQPNPRIWTRVICIDIGGEDRSERCKFFRVKIYWVEREGVLDG